MSESSRYVVGLDLGTTNCALSYIDTSSLADDVPVSICSFSISQVVKAGEVGEDFLLPSFLYLPAEGESTPGQLQLPWAKDPHFAVGRYARDHGSQVPTRLVSSSKSWLCHPGVDRKGKILPWMAEADFKKISPLDAAVRLLEHLRDAWNHQIAGRDKASRLESQDIILTVPASFDAVARELTMEGAKLAGLSRVTLFEEPQAAFYSWLHQAGDEWRKQVRPGDVALVVDVGGGTTDLTLIGVGEENGDLTLDRIAVGDHLLLGGDNMDLTLAHGIAQSLREKGNKIDSTQMLGLWHACRHAKEQLFRDSKVTSRPVTLLGKGRKVIGGTVKADLERTEVERVLVDGFFPRVDWGSEPRQEQRVGLQELGLSYATDPAITKHLSAFLGRHSSAISEFTSSQGVALPTCVLFNGGVFQASVLRDRVLEVLRGWPGKGSDGSIRELPAADLDRSVAHGAAYYGLVRRGKGVRIRGGVARSYYIGVESAMPAVPGFAPPIKALCIVPQGTEEGSEVELAQREFGLVVGAPAVFRFLGSSQRRGDAVGTFVEDWEETIEELAPLETTLEADGDAGQAIPVRLHGKVTEVGTLELWCQSRDGKRKWKLEFNVREPSA
ncbi:MAG: Hsp70 family protein [Planctomycetota bacterium]